MASLTKGLFYPPIRPLIRPQHILSQLSSSQLPSAQPRLFTTSFLRLAVQPATKTSQTSKSSNPSPQTAGRAAPPSQSSYGLVKNLAAKPSPTTLYEGASPFWFYFGCWSTGLPILAWTALTNPGVIAQPLGTPDWITYVIDGAYVLLAGMGFTILYRTFNIVKSIRVIPEAPKVTTRPAPVPAPAATLPVATGRATPGPAALKVEVTVHRTLPFLSPRVITTDLKNVSLKSRFSLPEAYAPGLRGGEQQRQAEARKRELAKFDKEHLLTMPFRKVGRGFAAMFNGVRAAWTDMGYGVIRVDGKEFKVNVVKGFAHDGFRTLERLVPVKEK